MLLVAAVLCAHLLTFDIDVMCLSVSGPRTLPAAAGAAEAAPNSRFRVRHFAGVARIHVIIGIPNHVECVCVCASSRIGLWPACSNGATVCSNVLENRRLKS